MPGLIAGVFVAVVILVAGWFLLPGRSESRPAGSSPVAVPFTPTFTQLTSQPGVEHYVTLSPNGRNFAYASDSGGNFDIFVQRVGGRNPINLTETCAEDDTMPSFSPDGESIVFRSQCEGGGLFVMGATGESIRRLTDMGYNPSWSPDGSRVLFTEAIFNVPQSRSGSRSRLMTVDVASREVRTILDADSVQASFSPNGHRIAYWGLPVDGGGQRDIYTVSADGKDIVPVTQDTALDWSPVWSPDGRFLYYSSDHGGAMNIWRVPIDEKTGETFGPPQPVTAGVTSWSQHLSISADGRRLAYVSETRYSDMYRISYDPETRSVVGLPERLDAASRLTVGGCTPAPDGEWLACAKRDPVEDIIIVRSDGSDRRQLTDDGHKDRYPVWSRDGSKILFYSDRTGKYDAWTINRDGSGLEQVTHAAGDTLFPTWSPDGKSLTYADFDNWKTYMIDPGRPWTDQTPQSLDLVKDGHTIAVQSWSPDSTKVAGVTYKNQTTSGMGAFDLAAGEFKLFLPYPSQPWWMPDNHTLLYADQRTLSLVDSDTGETHRLLKMDNIDPFSPRVSPDGRTLYFAGGPLEADIWLMEIED